ncbi:MULTISPECIES: hypothetical protein [unclassified Modestobacter]|uniref:hypothetical protein n=1 Tax=unclassified Modestobacter TaxID=2643866 RepID=UPI0022AA2BBE|nr:MULTISPECIES: hypothetical protein [unclassified Modestobacter]MCZ2826019.1 hypothetical protein [Modestobacter sp. VKM Ac-2981]MCZ2852916.1 hypothetical protein [Modestobacter sp. VKM Ac-2982]
MGGVAHGPGAKTRQLKYIPKVIEDWAAFDAAIDAYLGEQSRAPSTRSNHEKNWERWKRLCAETGVRFRETIDPLRAPFLVFEDLALECREDGLPLSAGTIGTIVAAVGWHYEQAGLVPAHKQPQYVGDWKALMKGLKRRDGKRRSAGDFPRQPVKPLLRREMVQLLVAEPARTPRLDAGRAAVLLALDTRLLAGQLHRLQPGDVTLRGNQDVQAPGPLELRGPHGVLGLPCNHTDYVRGVPWDCTACAVRAVLAEHPGDGPLLSAGRRELRDQLKSLCARWPGLRAPEPRRVGLTPAPTLTRWERAGLRRGLVLAVGVESGFRWVRARAWTVTSWVCGFRMNSDLVGLDRNAVTPDPADRCYRIRLGGTKDDQPGVKDVGRPLEWSAPGGTSAAQAMAEYLCVRDAATGGREGVLLVKSPREACEPIDRGTTGDELAGDDLALLCSIAGLPAEYSSYSTRRGYAQQAQLDNWPLVDIQRGLRHQQLHTTLIYTAGAAGSRGPVAKLLELA